MTTHVLAAIGPVTDGGGTEGLTNPVLPFLFGRSPAQDAGTTALGRLVASLISFFIIIAALIALLYLVLGGLQWITSGGDKSGMEQARNKITHAVLGLIIVAASWAIWVLVGNFLGINFQHIPVPSLG